MTLKRGVFSFAILFVSILAFSAVRAEPGVSWQYIYGWQKRTFVSAPNPNSGESSDHSKEWWDPWTTSTNKALIFRSIFVGRYSGGAALTGRRSYYKSTREVYYDKTKREYSGTQVDYTVPYPTGAAYTTTTNTTAMDAFPGAFGNRCEPGIHSDCTDTVLRVRFTNNNAVMFAIPTLSARADHLFQANPTFGGKQIVSGQEYIVDTFAIRPGTAVDRSYPNGGITSVQPVLWGFTNMSYGFTK